MAGPEVFEVSLERHKVCSGHTFERRTFKVADELRHSAQSVDLLVGQQKIGKSDSLCLEGPGVTRPCDRGVLLGLVTEVAAAELVVYPFLPVNSSLFSDCLNPL